VLKWAREQGCEWDARTCEYAALGGHLKVLRWARENHCLWDERTCSASAQGGHLQRRVHCALLTWLPPLPGMQNPPSKQARVPRAGPWLRVP
jgi:hypothetical protein